MGCCGRLIGDGPMAQGHAHDGRHVSLGAKDVNGDPGGLPCEEGKAPIKEKAYYSAILVILI